MLIEQYPYIVMSPALFRQWKTYSSSGNQNKVFQSD